MRAGFGEQAHPEFRTSGHLWGSDSDHNLIEAPSAQRGESPGRGAFSGYALRQRRRPRTNPPAAINAQAMKVTGADIRFGFEIVSENAGTWPAFRIVVAVPSLAGGHVADRTVHQGQGLVRLDLFAGRPTDGLCASPPASRRRASEAP